MSGSEREPQDLGTTSPWEFVHADQGAGDEMPSAVRPPQGAGFYLTTRQTFLWFAGVLGVLLVGLVVYLIWLSSPADFTKEGGATRGGLKPVVAIYGPGTQPTPKLSQPMGVAWSRDGHRIYVADTLNNRICVFSDKGRPIKVFGQLGVAKPLPGAARTWAPGGLSYPVDIAVGDGGLLYVADFYNDSVSVFTEDGVFVRRFPDPYAQTGRGSSGQDGGGIAVTAVAVSGNKVYATDTYQIVVFDTEGRILQQFGRPGLTPDGLDHPGGIAVDRDGHVYVSDSNHNRVIAFSAQGKPIWVTGRPLEGLQKRTSNPFVLPRGITIMKDGSLLVADPLGQQLVRLDSNGKVVASYGLHGSAEGQLNFPNDVSMISNKVLVADRENQRAQVVKLSNR